MPRGARRLPEACRDLAVRSTLVVHTGDFTSRPVLEELEALGPPVAAVHGNMDEPDLRADLPAQTVVEGEDLRLGVVHDGGPWSGRTERLLAFFPDCDVVVYGHTHAPEITRARERWIVNPGSPTERRRAPTHTVAVIERGVPRLVEI